MKIKEILFDIFDTIYTVGVMTLLSPFLIFMAICHVRTKESQGGGE